MVNNKKKNLSEFNPANIPSAADLVFGIVVSDWNPEITGSLLDGAVKTLKKHGADDENIIIKHVPGSFELTFGAKALYDSLFPDVIICLGCVIQGETRHFDYICQSVTQGITQLNIDLSIPVIFGVLTVNNYEQAKERSGGKHGNKGDEAVITAIKMASLNIELEENFLDEEYYEGDFSNDLDSENLPF
ncbi:MAG: 6,7-dimethyl-8-ribityllumazine synthase [Bacteroidales bacterium]|nr:6,7-dimethyl-8-ribityllumazine synthase [Bacteroidales bacterium]